MDFDLKKEQQLLRSRWAIVKERVVILSFDKDMSKESREVLREWAVYAPSAGYLVSKKVLPFLKKKFSALQKKENCPFKFEWTMKELTDSLASDRQRKDIINTLLLRPRTMLLEAVKEVEEAGKQKTACRLLEQRLEKAEIVSVIGDYVFTDYVRRVRHALKKNENVLLKNVFESIKQDFRVVEEVRPEERQPSFYPPEGWKPLIIIRRYGR